MRKILLTLLALLSLGGNGAWATDIAVTPSNGVYWKNGAVTSDAWAPIWKSNQLAADGTTPLLVLTGKTGMDTVGGDIYSDQTYTLEAPSGYSIVSYSFNGSARGGDVTITPNGEDGTLIFNGSSLETPLSVAVGAQSTTFALSGGEYFTNLELTVKVEHYIVTYSTSTGSYTTNDNYVHEWNSTATNPQVKFAVSGGANNIAKSTGYIYSGASGCTYTLTAQNGYLITGYEIVGQAQTAAQTLTPAAGGSAVVFGTDKEYTLSVTGLSAPSTSFTQSTPNNGIAISSFKIFLENATASVTYVLSDATGEIFRSEALSANVGDNITDLPSALKRDFCSYEVPSTVVVDGENTVNVTVTYNLPFDISADYASAKWYYLNLKGECYPTYSSEGTPNVTLPSSRTLGDANALWAFIGNPYQGFSIVNKAAGSGLVLGSASPNGDGNTGGNTYATLGSGQAYERYFLVASTHYTNGFFLQTSEGYALNQRSTANLAYWTGGKDRGSTFVAEEDVENYYSRVEAEVIPFLMDGGGNPSPTIGKPFGLSSTAASSIVSTYMTQLNNQQFTSTEYLAIVAAKDAGIIYPTTGKFYLVKNNYNGKYMRVTASGTRGTVFADLTAEEAAKDASAHFTFVNNNSHLYMSTQGEYLNWVYSNGDGYEGYTSTNFDKYVHFANPAPGLGAFSIAYGNGEGNYAGYLYTGFYALKSNESTVVAGSTTNESDPLALWTFEEVSTLGITLNGPVDGKYYATLCVPFDITALEGATAYTLAKDGTTLNTTEISPIPAGTPVLLEGTTASATATIAAAASTTISTSTALTGQYFASTFDGATNYTLGTDGTKLGFYHWDGTTLGANRAYVAGSGNVKGFAINWGDADGINSVNNGQAMENARRLFIPDDSCLNGRSWNS